MHLQPRTIGCSQAATASGGSAMSFQTSTLRQSPWPTGFRNDGTPLGVLDVPSDALNTEACAAATTGQDWTELPSGALDIAVTARLDEQAGRAYANFTPPAAEHGGRPHRQCEQSSNTLGLPTESARGCLCPPERP